MKAYLVSIPKYGILLCRVVIEICSFKLKVFDNIVFIEHITKWLCYTLQMSF